MAKKTKNSPEDSINCLFVVNGLDVRLRRMMVDGKMPSPPAENSLKKWQDMGGYIFLPVDYSYESMIPMATPYDQHTEKLPDADNIIEGWQLDPTKIIPIHHTHDGWRSLEKFAKNHNKNPMLFHVLDGQETTVHFDPVEPQPKNLWQAFWGTYNHNTKIEYREDFSLYSFDRHDWAYDQYTTTGHHFDNSLHLTGGAGYYNFLYAAAMGFDFDVNFLIHAQKLEKHKYCDNPSIKGIKKTDEYFLDNQQLVLEVGEKPYTTAVFNGVAQIIKNMPQHKP